MFYNLLIDSHKTKNYINERRNQMSLSESNEQPNIKQLKAKGDVKSLIKALGHNDIAIKSEASKALVQIGTPAVESLIAVVAGSGESYSRARAVEALGEIGDKRAVEPLIKALKDKEWMVGMMAAGALGKLKDKRAVEPLIQAIQYEDWALHAPAARSLGTLRDPRAVKVLTATLNDSNEEIRKAASEALTAIGDLKPEESVASDQAETSSNLDKVVFVKNEYKKSMIGNYSYIIYKAPDADSAMAFLDKNSVTEQFVYIVVETPEGNYCRDIEGTYKE